MKGERHAMTKAEDEVMQLPLKEQHLMGLLAYA